MRACQTRGNRSDMSKKTGLILALALAVIAVVAGAVFFTWNSGSDEAASTSPTPPRRQVAQARSGQFGANVGKRTQGDPSGRDASSFTLDGTRLI